MDSAQNGGRDSRYNNIGYDTISMLNAENNELYANIHNRPTSITSNLSRSSISLSNNNSCSPGLQRGLKRTSSDNMCFDQSRTSGMLNLNDDCSPVMMENNYSPSNQKGSPPSNGKKTKGRVKIKMEYIDNKLRRYTTFSKRKTGIMKKAYELSTLTGTQVMLLVASETGHVYTFATRKLQPMITSDAGKALIQTCLNSPDPCPSGSGDQRMSATGFEETELSYNIADDEKVRQLVYGGSPHSHLSSSTSTSSGHPLHHSPHQQPPHPSLNHHSTHPHLHHHQQHSVGSPHLMSMTHPHAQSPPSHLIPCSSPSPMLASTAAVFHQQQQHPSCSSPLPHSVYPQHISHSHTQR